FRVPNPSVLESRIRVMAADKAGNRTVREIDLGDPTAPLGLPKAAVDKGKPDPTLLPKDDIASPVAPPVDRNVQGAGHAELPKAPRGDLPDLPPLPEIKPEGAPDVKSPDATGIKIPDPPGTQVPDA